MVCDGATVKSTVVGKRVREVDMQPLSLPAATDVLIVGAGPVGLTMATAFVAEGVDVLIVDRQKEGANTSRAAVVHARTLEVLEGIGVTGELVRRGRIVPRFTMRD